MPRGLHDLLYTLPGDEVHCSDGTDRKENQLEGSPVFDSGALFFSIGAFFLLPCPPIRLFLIGSFGELFRWPLLWEFCLDTLRGGRFGRAKVASVVSDWQ